MPWTPIAVSAWRTSSSLNGLMMATTSFMSGPPVLAIGSVSDPHPQSGIFLGNWHKKVARLRGCFGLLASRPCTEPYWVRHNGAAGVQIPLDKTTGGAMAERSWFYAAGGQQQGPVSETQLRDLIARGMVTSDTLVWSEGMAAWQKAGEVPGLLSGAVAPPTFPGSGGTVPTPAGYGGASAMSVDFGIWDYVWRTVVLFLGAILVIPAP